MDNEEFDKKISEAADKLHTEKYYKYSSHSHAICESDGFRSGAHHAKTLLARELKIAAWFEANKGAIKSALEYIAYEYAENEARSYRVALDLCPVEEEKK